MRLEEVVIHVLNAKETALFYENLGAEVIHKEGSFHISIGQSKLIILPSTKPWTYHLAFNISFVQVEPATHWLKKYVDIQPFEGQEIVEFPNWKARAIYFYDPAGNILELIGRRDFKEKGKAPFQFSSILNISEVGWPVENVDDASKRFPMAVYSQFGPDFAAIGDEEGLFIVVNADKKHWIPNEDETEFSPAKVKASFQDHQYLIERDAGSPGFSVQLQ